MQEFQNKTIQQLYEQACNEFIELRGTPDQTIFKALQVENSKYLQIILYSLYFQSLCFSTDDQIMKNIIKDFENSQESQFINDSKQILNLYYQSLEQMKNYNLQNLIKIYNQIIQLNPFDLFALRSITNLAIYNGDIKSLYECMSLIEQYYEKDNKNYNHFASIYSFALEEMNQFDKAMDLANQSLAQKSNNVFAIHTIAHVYEMKQDNQKGIQFLIETENIWNNTLLKCHIAWHLTLYYIELKQIDKALEIFKKYIYSQEQLGVLNLVDYTIFLWKINQQKDYWLDLYQQFKKYNNIHITGLNDLCQFLTYLKYDEIKNEKNAQIYMQNIKNHIQIHENDYTFVMNQVGLPIMQAFIQQQLPQELKNKLFYLGGSNAQRKFINQTFI